MSEFGRLFLRKRGEACLRSKGEDLRSVSRGIGI